MPFVTSIARARVDLSNDGRVSPRRRQNRIDRKSTRLNSSHRCISYAVFCLKKKKKLDVTISSTLVDLAFFRSACVYRVPWLHAGTIPPFCFVPLLCVP